MVDALFILILVRLAAALVHALLRHICCREALSEWWEGQLRAVYRVARNILEVCGHHVIGVRARSLILTMKLSFFGIKSPTTYHVP
jgi:hypothetical protein